jgi:hypothetical protein
MRTFKRELCVAIILMLIMVPFMCVTEADAKVDEDKLSSRIQISDTPACRNRKPSTTPTTSTVNIVNGIPRLLINNEPVPLTGYMTIVDPYSSPTNFSFVMKYIDYTSESGFTFMLLELFWANMDPELTLPSFPEDAAQRIDWSVLDRLFDYAASKGVYLMPVFTYGSATAWWYTTPNWSCQNYYNRSQVNNDGEWGPMPCFNASEHWKYADQVISFMVNRYKNHPALLGWELGTGWTNENNYMGGGSYGTEGWFDYSNFTKEQFRDWLKGTYSNDENALKTAWNDTEVAFDTAEFPQPLTPDPAQDLVGLNLGGDDRRQFYDWQMFRLHQKKLDRDHFGNLYKQLDPDHVLFAIPGSFPLASGLLLDYAATSLITDYYEYGEAPYVDGVFIAPSVKENQWEDNLQGSILYPFAKYWHSRGKVAFIDFENWGNFDQIWNLRSWIYYLSALGIGVVWNAGGILGPDGSTIYEYSDVERAELNKCSYLIQNLPKFIPRKEKLAILDSHLLPEIDYQKMFREEGDYWLTTFKLIDTLLLGKLFADANLEYDVLCDVDVISNPSVLNNYTAIAVPNIFRMTDELKDVLVDYRNDGGGLFLIGRSAMFNRYGNYDSSYLKEILGVSTDISEYQINLANPNDLTWNFVNSDSSGLINGLKGKECDNLNLYYIPYFDYASNGYSVIGHLKSNPNIGTLIYKDKTIFWAGKFGSQVFWNNANQQNNLMNFLRNLYDFYGIKHDDVEKYRITDVGGNYKFLLSNKLYDGKISFDLDRVGFNQNSEYLVYDWTNMAGLTKIYPIDTTIEMDLSLEPKTPRLFSITECTPDPSFVASEWAVFEGEEWSESGDLLTIDLKTNTNAKVAVYLSNKENYTISLDAGDVLNIAEDTATDTLLIVFHPSNTQAVLEVLFGEEIEDDTPPSLNIERPLKYLYIFDQEMMPTIFGNTIIMGKITIKADAMDNQSGMKKVEFYIDDVLKNTDTYPPYEWLWNELIIGRHTIKVIAYDSKENFTTDDIMVRKFL